VEIEAGLLRSPAILLLAVPGHGDQDGVVQRGHAAQPARRLVTADVRQPDVDET
jgi:hypothetical protein